MQGHDRDRGPGERQAARAHLGALPAADEALVREAALADPGVAKFVAGQPVRKLIYVPGKLVNVVV